MDNEEGRNILVPVDDAEVRVSRSQKLDRVQSTYDEVSGFNYSCHIGLHFQL